MTIEATYVLLARLTACVGMGVGIRSKTTTTQNPAGRIQALAVQKYCTLSS